MKKNSLYLVAILFVIMFAGNALAVSKLNDPLPDSLIVKVGSFDWVYAGPCAPQDPSCGVVLLRDGFEIPNAAEWNASFSNLNALLVAFNIPNGVVPNAAPYFNTVWDHIDIGDAQSGYVWGAPFVDAAHASNPASEAFLVRPAGPAGVPEPATMLLLGLGLVGLAGARRKFKK